MVRLSLALLGPLEVRLDGQPVTTFESGRVRALLAYLAVESTSATAAGSAAARPHPREALAELLWPGWAAASAQSNLRHALSSLRRTLGDATATPPFLRVTRDTLAFDPQSDHELDAVTFARLTRASDDVAALEQAVALYRGPFLDSGLLSDSAAYEAWTLQWREHYARALGAALERLAEHYLEREEPSRAEGHARRLLAMQPLSEAAHRQVMRILAASGKRNEAVAQYVRCRELLAQELGVEPDPQTTRLYDDLRAATPSPSPRVVATTTAPRVSERAQPSLAPPPPTPGPVAEPSATVLPRLHQLPPAPADFRGRETELQELRDAVLREGVRLCAIRGLGGMGKTSLALRLAEQLRAHYPDAQIYLDLRGTERQPATPSEAMAHVIHSFHPLAQLPEGEAELGALYQSVLQGKRALLLLDNARDRAQVEALLPPASCLLLLTSRQRSALPGLHALDLGVPKVEEATGWLRSIAPRLQASEAEALAQVCGCLPLALRVAGSALAEWEDLAPEEYLAALRAHQSGLATQMAPVESSLAHSDALLDEALRHRWYALGVFPGTFERSAAEAVWGGGSEKVVAPGPGGLSELVRYSLVEYDPQSRRYRLHDLCRAYALEHLDAEEGHTARLRHATYYGGVLDKARTLFFRLGQSSAQGAAAYDREVANIEGAFAWLAGEAERNVQAARLCVEYVNPPPFKLAAGTFRLLPRQRIPWEKTALRAARFLGDRQSEVECLLSLAQAHLDTGTEPERVSECAQEALDAARALPDPQCEAVALFFVGMACVHRGQYSRATECLGRGAALAHTQGFGIGESNCLVALAEGYLDTNHVQKALECSQRAMAIHQMLPDSRPKGYACWLFGRSLAAVGEPRQGIPYLERAEAIFREGGPLHDLALSLNFLGEACCAAGDVARAIACHEEARALCRPIGRLDVECKALWDLGWAYAVQRDAQRIVPCYEEALALAREHRSPYLEGLTLWHMSKTLYELGERERAIACAELCLRLAEEARRGDIAMIREQLAAWRAARVT